MMQYSYAHVRANLGKVMDKVLDDAEIIIFERQKHERVALISADELERMQEKLDILRICPQITSVNGWANTRFAPTKKTCPVGAMLVIALWENICLAFPNREVISGQFLSSPEYLRLIKAPTEQRVARD